MVARKHGNRSDTYYLSPPGPNQVKKNSLKQAKLYQQQLLSEAASSATTNSDDDQLVSTAVSSENAADGITGSDVDDDNNNEHETACTDQEKSASPVSKAKLTFDESDGDSDCSSDDSNASSTDLLLYSSHPSSVKTPVNFKLTYERVKNEFLEVNGLEHTVPQREVNGFLETAVDVINAMDPDNQQFGSTKKLVKYLKKEAKKKASKTESNTALTISQQHALKQMLKAYSDGKNYGVRTIRWHVHAISAIAKLMNRTITVLSPPLDGKSTVSVLRITPSRYHDFFFPDGANYFPRIEDFYVDTDSESDSDSVSITLNSKSTAIQQSFDANDIIVSAVMNFESNQLVGYKGIVKSCDNCEWPTDTDSDEDVDNDSAKLIIPTATLKPRKKSPRENDPYTTPQPKRKKDESYVAMPPPIANPYKTTQQLTQGKSSVFTAVSERSGNHASGGGDASINSKSGVGWGSSPEVMELLDKKLGASASQNSRGGLVLEITHGITDRISGKKVHLAIIRDGLDKVWYFKYEPTMNPSFKLFFSLKGPDTPASCYSTWGDSSIRAQPYGENKVLRRGRAANGSLPYPKKFPVFEVETLPSGFPINTVVKQFEVSFKSMTSDASVLVAYYLNHLEEIGSSLLTMFNDGKFRSGKLKNKAYENVSELKQQLKQEVEDTFQHGFSRIIYDNFFDKHYTDFTIQEFLIKLGYNAFEELNENERKLIYRDGRFPDWNSIVEEPDRAN